jgi:DNA-binding NarL/FixJ family response regulator
MVFGASLAARVATYFASARPAGQRDAQSDAQSDVPPFPDLTDREREVLDLLASGASNDSIARATYVSDKTVRNTISSIYAKLHASGRGDAIVKAREAGFGKG